MTNTNKGKEETDRVTEEGRSIDIYRTAEEGDLRREEERKKHLEERGAEGV